WVWVGEQVGVWVEVVDAFGNRCDVSQTINLTFGLGMLPTTSVWLEHGHARLAIAWSEPHFGETVKAVGAGLLAGVSDPFPVVRDCGASGPTPRLTFSGREDAIACFD